jgi:hypothetical protein
VAVEWATVPAVSAGGDPCAGGAQRVTDDWADLLVALLDSGARFIVVGAHALAVHGVPRATQDLDVWVEPTLENAERVWEALIRFGAPLDDMDVSRDDFVRPNTVIQIGLPPNRVDVLTGITGVVDFNVAWTVRTEHEVGGRAIPFLGRATLVTNKRATGRLKDLADVEALGEQV